MAAEIQTDSETEEESTESLTPAGTSIDSIIQNTCKTPTHTRE